MCFLKGQKWMYAKTVFFCAKNVVLKDHIPCASRNVQVFCALYIVLGFLSQTKMVLTLSLRKVGFEG